MKAKTKAQPKYDEEELEILQALEAGQLKPVTDSKNQIKAHRAAADATFKKDQRLNIRICSAYAAHIQPRLEKFASPRS